MTDSSFLLSSPPATSGRYAREIADLLRVAQSGVPILDGLVVGESSYEAWGQAGQFPATVASAVAKFVASESTRKAGAVRIWAWPEYPWEINLSGIRNQLESVLEAVRGVFAKWAERGVRVGLEEGSGPIPSLLIQPNLPVGSLTTRVPRTGAVTTVHLVERNLHNTLLPMQPEHEQILRRAEECCHGSRKVHFSGSGEAPAVMVVEPQSLDAPLEVAVLCELRDRGRLSDLELLGALPRVTLSGLLPHSGFRLAGEQILKGIPASRGLGVGKVLVVSPLPAGYPGASLLTAKEAEAHILLFDGWFRPEHLDLLRVSAGSISRRWGLTRELAVYSRWFSVPCVVGVQGLEDPLQRYHGRKAVVDGGAGTVALGNAFVVGIELGVAPGCDDAVKAIAETVERVTGGPNWSDLDVQTQLRIAGIKLALREAGVLE